MNNSAPSFINYLIFAFALGAFGLCLTLYVIPDNLLNIFHLAYDGASGLSTLRGDLGGRFGALGVVMLLGLMKGKSFWLVPAGVLLSAIIAGRIIGLVFDGYVFHTVAMMGIEVVMLVTIIIGYMKMTREVME